MTSRRRLLSTTVLVLLLAAAAFAAWKWRDSRGTLWRIVSTSCLPATQSGGTGRCAAVSAPAGPALGHVVFKDRQGPLQYLLMPTQRISGIEDPFLRTAGSPNYWAEAWRARRWMDSANGAPVPREAVSITVNAAWGRTQDQLHLHISCTRRDLLAFLATRPEARREAWTPVPGGWAGHPYEVRRFLASSLDDLDLFKDVAQDHPDDMGTQGLAAIATRFGEHEGFWLLRTHTDLRNLWLASIEGDVQDHACPGVRPSSLAAF